tara:strand:+ start:3546 stop:3815 length:270 start_codon:yes stop_codon:yes gene_type:complete
MAIENFSTFYANLNPWIILGIVVWETIWKGFGMWRAARLSKPIWFVAILILNTIGILPILYLFVFSKTGKKKNANKIQKTSKRKTSKKS